MNNVKRFLKKKDIGKQKTNAFLFMIGHHHPFIFFIDIRKCTILYKCDICKSTILYKSDILNYSTIFKCDICKCMIMGHKDFLYMQMKHM